jgi:hypothetical protein
MRSTICSVALLFALGCAPATPAPNAITLAGATPVNAQDLIGTWTVDLRPRPGDAEYFQEFVIAEVPGKGFTGTFYGTKVEQARINTDWGAVRIAFVTSDQSGEYHHSAVLKGGRLEGLSNSTGRDFLSYWSAVKKK